MSDDEKAARRLEEIVNDFYDEDASASSYAPVAAPAETGGYFEDSAEPPAGKEASIQESHPEPACNSDPGAAKGKGLMIGLGVASAVAASAIIATVIYMSGGDSKPAASATSTSTSTSPVAPRGHAPRTSPPAAQTDQQIRNVTLDDQGQCPSGSTPPSFATDGDATHAFVCLRDGRIGQVFIINLDGSYKVTSISFVNGALGVGGDGQEEYWRHRVITKVRFVFPNPLMPENPDAARFVDCYPPTTPAAFTVAVDPPALATKITMQILETAVPTPPPPTTTDTDEDVPAAPGAGGFWKTPPAQPTNTTDTDDPHVSDSVALSSLTVQGHIPQ